MDIEITASAVAFAHREDFANALNGSAYVGAGAATGAVAELAAEATHPGIVQFAASAVADRYGALLGPVAILLGSGAWGWEGVVRFPTLSTGAQEYIARFGLLDTIAADAVDGCYFEYDRATSGDVWRCKTSSNSVRTTTATATAIAAATWYRCGVRITSDGVTATFYVDGALLATHSTNVPIGAGRQTSSGIWITKTVGATARLLDCDLIEVRGELAAAR